MAVPLGPLFEVHVEGGVGAFTGLSGRLTQSDWGFSVGAGLDYYVAPRWALTAYGRWNGAAIAPVPHFLPPRVISGRPQNPEDQGPADIRWATGGIGLRYDFRRPPVVLETAPPEPWVAQVPPPATYVPPPAPTPARLPPPPPTDVRLPPPPRRIVLRDVHFAYDSARILPDSFARLDRAAATLRELGWPDVVVEGHTDSRGTDAYNDALSQRRADAVRRYLIERGAPAQSLRAVGYGERRPVASNETASGRAENRRVELNLQGGARSDPRYY